MSQARKILAMLILIAVVVLAGMQAIRPSLGTPGGPQQAIAAPPQVREILERRCYACHSDEPKLVWFDQIAPAYWLVAKDVRDARAHLNFSELGAEPAAAQRATLFEAVAQIQLGAMPLPRYLAVHRDEGVTADELNTLKAYLAPFAPAPAAAPTPVPPVAVATSAATNVMPAGPSLNGVPYFPDYKNWKLVSTTDRGDNNTLRIITGNDVAIRAAADRKTNPWPDGAVFAKISLQAVNDGQGHISPGKFVQVEFMVKDHAKYAATEGWGFARWRGDDLKPYGKDAHFDNECAGCHAPMRDNDYVYTLPLAREEVSR
jgi:hypothetical protein